MLQAIFGHKGEFLFEEHFDLIFVFHEAYYYVCKIFKQPRALFSPFVMRELCNRVHFSECLALSHGHAIRMNKPLSWETKITFWVFIKSVSIYLLMQLSLMIQMYL
jgi:hypothetical protein